MPRIEMIHPTEGRHVCYSEGEVTYCRKFGWKPVEIPALLIKPEVKLTLEEQYFAKFGKKPHHKTNIEKALNDDSK